MTFACLPKAVARRFGGDARETWHRNVVLSHLILLGLAFFSPALGSVSELGGFCLFRYFTSLPCLGCGITSSLAATSQGKFARAVETNPAGLVIVAAIIVQAVLHGTAVCWAKQERGLSRISTGLERCVLGFLFGVWLCRLSVYCT